MPGRQTRAKPRAFGPWVDPDLLPPLPRPKKNRKPKQKKRFHHSFRVLIALGLIPTKSRQCDPLGLRLNRMHVMEGDCEKSSGCLTAEGPPEIAKADEDGGDEKETARTKIPNGDHTENEIDAEIEKVNEKENGENGEESDAKESEENDKEEKEEIETKEESNEEKAQEDVLESEKTSEEVEKEEMECADQEIEEENEEEKKDDEKQEEKDEKDDQVDTKETIKEEEKVDVKDEGINETVSEKPSSPQRNEEKPETAEEVVRPEERKTPTISNNESRGEKSKRSIKREGEEEISSGNESDSGRKKMRMEPVETQSNGTTQPAAEQFRRPFFLGHPDPQREKLIHDYVADCSRNPDEFDNYINELQKEVKTLTELAKEKEIEWNGLLHVRKIKEEMLERILRQKRINNLHDLPEKSSLPEPKNYTNKTLSHGSQHELNMVPIVSSSPSLHSRSVPTTRNIHMSGDHNRSIQRPILPKPNSYILPYEQPRVVDVKSIIADYRARHPESVPRRGRRVPQEDPSMFLNRQQQPMISVANLLLGSGSRVRTMRDSPYSYPQETPHPSSVDAARELESFKDHFKFNENASKAPPPYPEVTLHPVTRPNSPPTSSLLHGILTKTTPSPVHRPATFSPTLARLLTAPENPANPTAPVFRRPQNSQKLVSVADILKASKQQQQKSGANEITITPVPGGPPAKPKEDVVLLDDDDAESGDRLVIDEGGENEDVPQCQGCKQKSSQFVCAGCGNQWYCSRECQVTAWEEHSEVCSG